MEKIEDVEVITWKQQDERWWCQISRALQDWTTTLFSLFWTPRSLKIVTVRLHELMCSHEILNYVTAETQKDFSRSVTIGADEGGKARKNRKWEWWEETEQYKGERVTFKSLHFKCAWLGGFESWAFSSTWISHTIHLYANRTAVVQPQYQQKPLWYSKQTFVSLLCCQHRDNEATGTYPTKPRLSCSLQTSLIITPCKPSHLVKCLSQPITTKSIASLITLIWRKHELFVYSLTYSTDVEAPHHMAAFRRSGAQQRESKRYFEGIFLHYRYW